MKKIAFCSLFCFFLLGTIVWAEDAGDDDVFEEDAIVRDSLLRKEGSPKEKILEKITKEVPKKEKAVDVPLLPKKVTPPVPVPKVVVAPSNTDSKKTAEVAVPPSNVGNSNHSMMVPAPDSKKENILWLELRLIWIFIGFLLLSFLFAFLHLFLPFQPMRFLGVVSQKLQWFVWFGLLLVLLERVVLGHQFPGENRFTSFLLIALSALWIHLRRQKEFGDVALHNIPLNLLLIATLFCSLLGKIVLPAQLLENTFQSPLWLFGMGIFYVGLGSVLVGFSWQLTSGFLGLLAKGNRGLGYGIQPELWPDYKLQSSFFAQISFLCFSASAPLLLIWSQLQYNDAFLYFKQQPNLWSLFFFWFSLGAYFFFLRSERTHDVEDEMQKVHYRGHGLGTSLLLFLTSLLGMTLFIASKVLTHCLIG